MNKFILSCSSACTAPTHSSSSVMSSCGAVAAALYGGGFCGGGLRWALSVRDGQTDSGKAFRSGDLTDTSR